MKRYMIALAGALVLSSPLAATAGERFDRGVTILANDGFPGGIIIASVGGARNTPDQAQRFDVLYVFSPNEQRHVAAISAEDLHGKLLTCIALDEQAVAASHISGDMFVEIDVDGDGNCTTVTLEPSSAAAPKTL
jgi:hypothetical protein